MAGLIPLSIMPIIGSIFGILISVLCFSATIFLYHKYAPLKNYYYGPAAQVKELSQRYLSVLDSVESSVQLQNNSGSLAEGRSAVYEQDGSARIADDISASGLSTDVLIQLIRSYREDLNRIFARYYFEIRRKQINRAVNQFHKKYLELWYSVDSSPAVNDIFADRKRFILSELANSYLARTNVFVFLPLELIYQKLLEPASSTHSQSLSESAALFRKILQTLPQQQIFQNSSSNVKLFQIAYSFMPNYLPPKVALPEPILPDNNFTAADLEKLVNEFSVVNNPGFLDDNAVKLDFIKKLTTLKKAGEALGKSLYYQPKRVYYAPILLALVLIITLIPAGVGITQGYYLSLQYRAENLVKDLETKDLFADVIGSEPQTYQLKHEAITKSKLDFEPLARLSPEQNNRVDQAISLWKKGTQKWFVSNAWLAAYNTGTLEALRGDNVAAEKSFAQAQELLPALDLFYRSETFFLARCRLAENALVTAEKLHGDKYLEFSKNRTYISFCNKNTVEQLQGFIHMSGEEPDPGVLAEIKYYVSLNSARLENQD